MQTRRPSPHPSAAGPSAPSERRHHSGSSGRARADDPPVSCSASAMTKASRAQWAKEACQTALSKPPASFDRATKVAISATTAAASWLDPASITCRMHTRRLGKMVLSVGRSRWLAGAVRPRLAIPAARLRERGVAPGGCTQTENILQHLQHRCQARQARSGLQCQNAQQQAGQATRRGTGIMRRPSKDETLDQR